MLTANMNVKDGLVNGAVGILQEIEYREGGTDEIARLWIKFDANTGRLTRLKAKPVILAARRRDIWIMPDWVPIEMLTLTVTIDRKTGLACRRKQFPVVQASAVTVHKSQGATYASVAYEYDRKHPQKLAYVALSRCTDVNRLYLTNAKGDFTFYHGKDNVDRDLLDEFRRLESHHLDTIDKACTDQLGQPHTFALAALNIRSLRKHFVDVTHDPVLGKMQLLCLSETWTDALLQEDGYTGLACNMNVESRAGGVAIYVKNEFVGGVEAYPLPAVDEAVVSVCADACAVRLNNGTLIATVYISPATPKKEIETFMVNVFKKIKPADKTSIVIVGDFNVDVSRPDGAWILTFMLERFGLKCFTDATVPTTRHRSCIDLTFGKNIDTVKVQPLAVYRSDHKAMITMVTK